ncbi:MAG: hypothetical protein CMI63_16640 [Parvularcula sp.]|nr:hypothetical protein [Parvularcula sp.]
MTRFFLKFAGLCAAVILLCGQAAAEDQAYLEEFRAYTSALDEGDLEAALRHGYAAWQSAEAELGDDKLTAILAYNYGQLAIYSDPSKANIALARAKELAGAGLADLPKTELELYLAYTAFKLDEDSRRAGNALRDMLEQLVDNNAPPNRDTATMWYELASADMKNKRYRDARESASRAEAMIAAVFPDNYRTRAAAIMFQGVSLLAPMPRKERTIIQAIEKFQEAVLLFPPQESIENFDGILAQIFAWQAAAKAVYLSNDFSRRRLPEGTSEFDLFEGEHLSFEQCGGAWAEREPPNYPRRELFRGYVGAVLIGFNFADDTNLHDVRILAEVPERSFGDAVLEEVSNWKLTAPLPDDARCRKNKMTWVTFVID